jgi:predicted KAP-like P-loop ATPase
VLGLLTVVVEKIMMFPDNPVLDPTLDKFNRFPFSQRIAEVISSRHDSSGIVIGIYGAWGEGKTTVFNFIETTLENDESIVCVRFNPWFFRDEEKLLLSFFQTLADALKRKLTTRSEEIGGLLAKCGEILAPFSLADPTGAVRGSGQILEKLGNLFSQVNLEENKKRIEKILEEENKRLVIFIDDIDRLDKSEIQSIFKLVKISADFKNTTYLLAFDEEKVASAISEQYGSGDLEAGRSFLEKIIQVPLTLPQVSYSSLQKFCFECVDEALRNANLELTEEDVRRFVKCFSEGLAIQLKTPRVAQRYGNTLTFSIPLLKGEANIVDLLLIEGVKVFYPKLYSSIKDKPSYFLGQVLDQGGNSEQAKNIIEYIEQSISDLSREAQIYAKNLLKELFPRLTGVLGNIHHGSDWQIKWTQQKRIASVKYFKRYFAYSIPEDDISDQNLIVFLNKLEQADIAGIGSEIKKITNCQSSATDSFLTEIFRKIEQLSNLASQNLALALAEMGSYFPKSETLFSFESAFSRTGILVSHLIQKIDNPDKRLILAKQVLQVANPICFAPECFKWMRASKKDNEKEDSEDLFSESDISVLAEVVIHRIRDMAQEKAIDLNSPEHACELLGFWAHWSSKEETNNCLKNLFEQDPNSAVDFVKCYIPTVWSMGMESPYRIGLPSKGSLQRNTYDAIAAVVDAEFLVETLKKIYGDKLDSPEFARQNVHQSAEELAACQFVYIHNKVLADDAG